MNIPLFLRFLVLTAAFPHFLQAASPAPAPIEMRMGLGPLGSSLGYSLRGKDVNHYRTLLEIMGPLGDEATLRLLREAEDADRWSWGLLISGAVLGVVTALAIEPTPVLGWEPLDRAATGAAFAQFLVLPGTLFRFDAEGRKFNAVQRYNSLVRKEKLSSLDLGPRLMAGRGRWSLGLEGRF